MGLPWEQTGLPVPHKAGLPGRGCLRPEHSHFPSVFQAPHAVLQSQGCVRDLRIWDVFLVSSKCDSRVVARQPNESGIAAPQPQQPAPLYLDTAQLSP